MVSLYEKLQVQSACLHGLQQLLLFYRYKKSELLTSPLGPGALPILFSNWLLPGQSKCSYKCFIKVFAEKLR